MRLSDLHDKLDEWIAQLPESQRKVLQVKSGTGSCPARKQKIFPTSRANIEAVLNIKSRSPIKTSPNLRPMKSKKKRLQRRRF